MVHVRLNAKETNPNPHINFITPLPIADPAAEDDARQLLRALAAQVRPVMKANGFVVNSFEEYEHNAVFAGRNWNNGEVVELVLRSAGGAFLPTSWLLSTLCHELAHIKHMNHGPAFQALWAKLRKDVRELQSKGYYGDGYWSSGRRLADSTVTGGQGLDVTDLPEYMCGGAQSRTRPSSLRRRRRQPGGPSNRTGAQTAKKRKAGSRVTAQGTFKGSGHALNEDVSDQDQKKAGSGFRKKAGSKRAREERALAAERRLLALKTQAGPSTQSIKPEEPDDDDDDDDEFEGVAETDQDRRKAMLESADKAELDDLSKWSRDYSSDFVMPPPTTDSSRDDVLEISSDEDEPPAPSCSVQSISKDGPSTGVATPGDQLTDAKAVPRVSLSTRGQGGTQTKSGRTSKLSYGGLVLDEIKERKRESLGMNSGGRKLGGGTRNPPRDLGKPLGTPKISSSPGDGSWTCKICTLANEPLHLSCAACATPKGQAVWTGDP